MFARISPKSSGGRWLRLMLALLRELPSVNYQQFIDKGGNEEFVCLSNVTIQSLADTIAKTWRSKHAKA